MQKAIILNTPNKASHSDAHDWSSIFGSLFGGLDGIVDYGNKMQVKKINDTTIEVESGLLVLQGHLMKVVEGTKETVKIDSGTIGQTRIDVIVAEYVKGDAENDDSFSLQVVKGTPNAGKPAIISENLLTGGRVARCEIAIATINGITMSLTRSPNALVVYPQTMQRIDENGWRIEKYTDGRLRMWKKFNLTLAFAAHGVYYFRSVAGVNDSFPIPFVGEVNAAVNIGKTDASGASIWKGRTAISNTQVNQIIFFADGAVSQDVTFIVDIDGFWK